MGVKKYVDLTEQVHKYLLCGTVQKVPLEDLSKQLLQLQSLCHLIFSARRSELFWQAEHRATIHAVDIMLQSSNNSLELAVLLFLLLELLEKVP